MLPLSLAFSCRSERSEGGGISVRRKSRNIQLELLYHVFVHIDTDCSITGAVSIDVNMRFVLCL